MASQPGPLSHWPWEKLGSFKYLLLSPFAIKAIHTNFLGGKEADNVSLLLLTLVAVRYIHNQLWISISRYQNARSKRQIQSKSIQFEQVDREGNWWGAASASFLPHFGSHGKYVCVIDARLVSGCRDDSILMHVFLLAPLHAFLPGASNLPMWNSKGIVVCILAHVGPAEFFYYWAHRALHHHFLFTRYHSHHHSSFVTEAITSGVHPFAEHLLYAALFSMVPLAMVITKTLSVGALFLYLLWFDFMNNMGHCNFEFVPERAFQIFPPLKYVMYTPSFHSLHHSHVHTNFCLFMPLYDYLHGTWDKTSDALYAASWKGRQEKVDLVYLTHPTSLLSIFHLRFGFSSFAAVPYSTKWYMWILWPLSTTIMLFLRLFGRTFSAEKNRLNGLQMQTWVIPRYTFQYFRSSERPGISKLIGDSILDAEKKGVKVFCLGLLNQMEDLVLKKHENLKVRVVDGSTLAAAVVLNAIPAQTAEVFMCGGTSKVGCAIIHALCERGVTIKLLIKSDDKWDKYKTSIPSELHHSIDPVTSCQAGSKCKVWVVGEWLSREEQMEAPKGTSFIPFVPLPLRKARRDCTYYATPAMKVPPTMENVHCCENWLPRRVMSAWRVGGMVAALEEWDQHECEYECGAAISPADGKRVWEAALKHGFLPYNSKSEKNVDSN